ncbi:MAG: sigma-54-dependent Fis family transcriptional regulator, partial [Deltaproteobacteria bacterium]|nr:sigma-54-dependent Fis family transcriptional regulator [Deltaproteobacteria bacterium]
QSRYDVGLIDLKLPDGSGLDLIEKAQKLQPHLVTIAMTGHGSPQMALQAVQKGAFHYLTKPFSLEELKHLVLKALRHHSLEKENHWYQRELKHKYQFENIIGQSPAMMDVFKLIEKISQSDSTVLIRGESGTGKELIARAIHANGDRVKKPLVAVNCGALPEELLESELFGHVKGAFTGASSTRQGRFEIADQGTIFLDEVGDMSFRLQVKLLRVLQEQKFEPVGMSQTVDVNVRIIAATHQNLEQAVEEKKFREDLYYRLNVIPIVIPPLRDRIGDIPLLLALFLDKFNADKKKNVSGFSKEVMEVLSHYSWPGNVRELENLVERLVILKGQGEVSAKDLPDKYFSSEAKGGQKHKFFLPPEGLDLPGVIASVEQELIEQALARTGGNKNKAAQMLKLKRTTLVEKLKRKKTPRA